MTKGRRRDYTDQEKNERALISAMADWPLEPGQMLLMGPISVRKLTVPHAYDGSLPGTFVLNKEEWQGDLTARPKRGKVRTPT